ncbi:hypothetical protein [Geobacter sp. DSM 9736]|uniref:hypothetical protein n=1 Tax=Geobacter sp. DSM 9736 TaxID=1277350 RepID=UPI000B5131E0|nr:hypothetical protein [Geobacter sp. DSM 9736]SNB47609.1 hypothetical protein SAMN06269301_3100 [Geobacter sp. DSM 9736]
MKVIPSANKSRITIVLISSLIILGTVFILGINQVSHGDGFMVKAFLFFVGAIIAVQVIPGLMLFGAMIRGIASVSKKQDTQEEVRK